MKTFLRFSLLFILVIGLFTACRKDPEAPQTPTGPSGNFTARIANVDWSAEDYTAVLSSDKIILEGKTESGRTLRMEIAGTKAGTYAVNKNTASKAYFTDSTYSGIKAYTSQVPDTGDFGGTITVEKVDETSHTVSGSFKLNLIDTAGHYVVVENGKFSNLGLKEPEELLFVAVQFFDRDSLFFGEVYQGLESGDLSFRKLQGLYVGFGGGGDLHGGTAYNPITGDYFGADHAANPGFYFSTKKNKPATINNSVFAPVVLNGGFYGIVQKQIANFQPSTGNILAVKDSTPPDYAHFSATDGQSLYFIDYSRNLVRHHLASKTTTVFPDVDNGGFWGLECTSSGKLIGLTGNEMVEIVINGDGTVSLNSLLNLPGEWPWDSKCTLSKSKNKLYCFRYKLVEVDLTSLAIKELNYGANSFYGIEAVD